MGGEFSESVTGKARRQINTLGRFDILDQEGNLAGSLNRSNITWKLFKYLIINRKKDVPPEIILENLYPHEYYENPKSNVQNLIYRLRKMLIGYGIIDENSQIIKLSNGGYRLDFGDEINLDLDVFEEYISKARNMRKRDMREAMHLYVKGLAIYQGNLFPELIYDDWVIPDRNYYEKLYIQGSLEYIDLCTENGDMEAIIQFCEKALMIEPYEESIHIRYMETLLKQGKERDAQKHYEQTTDFFYKQFGIKPSEEMQEIYQKVKTTSSTRRKDDGDKIHPIWENNKGAFFCDYPIFHSIYVLEKRRSERSGKSVCAVSVEFEDSEKTKSKAFREKAIVAFKSTLTASLRKGDVVSVVDGQDFLVMLPELDYEQTRYVIDRITKKFLENPGYEGLGFIIKPLSMMDSETI